MKGIYCLLLLGMIQSNLFSQKKQGASAVELRGIYQNPILHIDYSDPDAIRVGDDFYMIASSFNYVPGIPILHSKNLVDWTLIGYALTTLSPRERYNKVQPGKGVWAPSIRYHNGEFLIYYPDPDLGIFLLRAKKITGPWSAPILVQEGKGLIDPCPFWDLDGTAYLVHAYAGSRAGIKSVLVLKRLSENGEKLIGDPILLYDGHTSDPTVEGPKMYRRNGYYYIFAPAGGVATGWQLALRSKNIWGPYERRIVMEQGNSIVNGPHQGAWVTTQTGEDWFLHFQDKGAYGRVVHLQPMKWINDWPVIGVDSNADGTGNPVTSFKKPAITLSKSPLYFERDYFSNFSDDFNGIGLGLNWQWQANPEEGWFITRPDRGQLRLFSQLKNGTGSLFDMPSVLTQKLPASSFVATVKFRFQPHLYGEEFGVALIGKDLASFSFLNTQQGLSVEYSETMSADKGGAPLKKFTSVVEGSEFYVRVTVNESGHAQFSFSVGGSQFKETGADFVMKPGVWVGARIGLYCLRKDITNDAGFADLDWIRFEKYNP